MNTKTEKAEQVRPHDWLDMFSVWLWKSYCDRRACAKAMGAKIKELRAKNRKLAEEVTILRKRIHKAERALMGMSTNEHI